MTYYKLQVVTGLVCANTRRTFLSLLFIEKSGTCTWKCKITVSPMKKWLLPLAAKVWIFSHVQETRKPYAWALCEICFVVTQADVLNKPTLAFEFLLVLPFNNNPIVCSPTIPQLPAIWISVWISILEKVFLDVVQGDNKNDSGLLQMVLEDVVCHTGLPWLREISQHPSWLSKYENSIKLCMQGFRPHSLVTWIWCTDMKYSNNGRVNLIIDFGRYLKIGSRWNGRHDNVMSSNFCDYIFVPLFASREL